MTQSPEEPGRHPFREELAARIRRRAFRPMALAFSISLIVSAVPLAAYGAFANGIVLGGFLALGVLLFFLPLWFLRRNWEPVFRQCRGRTVSVEGGDLVLRGPGAESARIRLADAAVYVISEDGGIREIRILPNNGNDAVKLLAFEDMPGLAQEIEAAMRASIQGGESDAPRVAARHRWRDDLSTGAKRRLLRRFIAMSAWLFGFTAFLLYFSPPNERVIAVPLLILEGGILGLACRTNWKKTLEPVRDAVASVEAGTLILARDGCREPSMMVELAGLRLREYHTRGVLDELRLCSGGTIVLRVFGFEDLDGLRDEIAATSRRR